MKKTRFLSTFSIALCVVVSGCDLSDGSQGGSTSQPGDTVIVDLPIAYIKRPVPIGLEDEDDLQVSVLSEDVMDPAAFRPGAKLIVKDRAAVSAPERVVTDRIYPAIQPEPTEDNPTPEAIEQLYDVRDLSPNSDGTHLVFSMRAPEIPGADDEMQPAWHIWEYDLAADELTQVTTGSLVVAGHSRFPVYLPDDSIVYSSTRQRDSKALLSDQGRPQYSYVTERDDEILAFTLHRIDADREIIEQISFGKGHDIYPTVLSDGRILFLRGDDTSGANDDRLSLYTMNPDGSNLSLHYGFHSPSGEDIEGQGALIRPLELPDGRIMVNYKSRQTNLLGGDIYAVDAETFIDNMQPTAANINTTGPAETSLSVGEVIIDNQSPHGYFNSAFPLFDGTGRLLVSWMPCTVQGYRFGIYVRRVDTDILDNDVVIGVDTTYELINIDGELVDSSGELLAAGVPAVTIPFEDVRALPCTISTFDKEYIRPSEPQYGIWVYDPVRGTQDPVVFANEPGTIYTEAVTLAPRAQPAIIPGPGADAFTRQLVDENVGIIHIRSIYDMDGQDSTADGIAAMADPLRTPTDSRPVRFVRFLEEANMPHEDEYEIERRLVRGRGNQNGKSIIGYSQVHPDGSVMAKVPANVPFTMEFLDANGRRVTGPRGARHRNWINLRPGEVRTCNGCHTAASTLPHGRADAEAEAANRGALAPANFTNTLLRDREGEPYTVLPEVGETMAEFFVRARLEDPLISEDGIDPLAPSIDIVYTDAWTDPASGATPGADIAFQYGNPEFPGPTNLLTQVPVRIGSCLNEWSAICRVVIDYPAHIQPIFEVPRMLGEDNITCINCHSTTDLDGNAQVPAPDMGNLQLDFTPVVSNLDDDMVFLKGYDELMAAGDPLFILDPVTGALQIQLIQVVIDGVPQFQTQPLLDENGSATFQATNLAGDQVCLALDTMEPDITFILDGDTGLNIPCMEYVYYVNADGQFTDAEGNVLADQTNPIRVPLFEPNLQNRYLNPSAGANANQNRRFFNTFSAGGAHEGYLTPAELKLFSEWLDVGGQYYNEIFKALED